MPTPGPSVMAWVVIGNPQHVSSFDWRDFHVRTCREIESAGAGIFGEWFNAPLALYENACFLIEVQPGIVKRLQQRLALVGADYGVNAVAWYDVADHAYLTPRAVLAERTDSDPLSPDWAGLRTG